MPSPNSGSPPKATTGFSKVARTIADLEGAEDLEPKHLSEAVQYRTMDRNPWV
jgi:magnesium chelatase family protein